MKFCLCASWLSLAACVATAFLQSTRRRNRRSQNNAATTSMTSVGNVGDAPKQFVQIRLAVDGREKSWVLPANRVCRYHWSNWICDEIGSTLCEGVSHNIGRYCSDRPMGDPNPRMNWLDRSAVTLFLDRIKDSSAYFQHPQEVQMLSSTAMVIVKIRYHLKGVDRFEATIVTERDSPIVLSHKLEDNASRESTLAGYLGMRGVMSRVFKTKDLCVAGGFTNPVPIKKTDKDVQLSFDTPPQNIAVSVAGEPTKYGVSRRVVIMNGSSMIGVFLVNRRNAYCLLRRSGQFEQVCTAENNISEISSAKCVLGDHVSDLITFSNAKFYQSVENGSAMFFCAETKEELPLLGVWQMRNLAQPKPPKS